MDFSFYPVFRIGAGDRIIPDIRLPDNCEELIKNFYDSKRKRIIVEVYRRELQRIAGYDISLKWDTSFGLSNISIGVHGGLDLDTTSVPWRFEEHNLGGLNSLIATAMATKYISELIKPI